MNHPLNVRKLLEEQAASVVSAAFAAGLSIVTAESCTAGRLAALLTDAPRAGDAVEGGFVTYTKEQKAELGVEPEIIARDGVVSETVARRMADRALENSQADIAISLTGVAGPEPDDEGNPVGLLYIAVSKTGEPTRAIRHDYGDIERENFMNKALSDALKLLAHAIAGARQV
jgi:nicotinamide-nucleotide amidase